ncbi:MAG: hypothetical protein DRJ07_00425 [Bacteroidetes bacterium]|nr:MAG: hypothetical protein DRJ07_00425 [Bacteroidota bacterium]
MNNKFWYIFFIILTLKSYHLSAQNKSISLDNHQFRLVADLDSLDLKTGDILFFQSTVFDGIMVQIGTFSPYTHSAMVILDPNGTLWLAHATGNDYKGKGAPVRYEDQPRAGVILTRIEDSFLSTNKRKTGFYEKIWIRKLNESKMKRPSTEDILHLYEKYKYLPFETSNFRFILTALDLRLFGKDLFSIAANKSIMCSEFLFKVLSELDFPINSKQTPNEHTPKDIYRLISHLYEQPLIYVFKNGMYQLK